MSRNLKFFDHWLLKLGVSNSARTTTPALITATKPNPLNELNYLQEIVFKINSAGQWLFLNQKWTEYTGYSIDESLSKSWLTHIHPQDHNTCREYLRRITKGQPESLSTPIRVINKQNKSRWMEMRANVLPCENPYTFNLTGTLTDISVEKSENERQLAQYRALLSLASNIPGMIYRCRNNRDWTMEFVSDGCIDLTGYDTSHITNSTSAWSDIIHPEAREYVWMSIQSAVQNQHPFDLTYRIVTHDGKEKWVWERGQGNFSANGELLGLEGLITDITANKRQSLRIERDSLFDPYTQLATQHLFLNRIQHVIECAKEQPGKKFSVVVANVSQHINPGNDDNQNQSDEVAKEIGIRLNSILLPSSTVCRLNTNEFGILIEQSKTAGINDTIRAVRAIQSCLKAPIKLNHNTLYTKVSLGVAQFNNHANNSAILGDANRASVQAKELGGDKIEFADAEQNIRMAAILGTEAELAKAIENNQLQLICQPLVSPAGNGTQALGIKIAWQHPRRGLLLAEHFYNHISDQSLFRQLGHFILRGIGDVIAGLPQNAPVNLIYLHGLGEPVLSGELLTDCIDTLSALHNNSDLQHPPRFIIDIDDKLLSSINHQGLLVLKQLQEQHIGIAAIGIKVEAPYAELLRLPGIQAIKLDLTAEPPNQTNLKAYNAMIACYHALDINVIGEGVDTVEINTAIKTSGFDYLQGSQVNLNRDL